MKKIVYGLILILIAVFLSGCMVGSGLKNHIVKQENQIDLIKGSRNIQGIWETVFHGIFLKCLDCIQKIQWRYTALPDKKKYSIVKGYNAVKWCPQTRCSYV